MTTEALYQELILEHNRKPRNFREMENADRKIEGRNPLCGDALTLWVKMDGDSIADVSFKGQGCAISKASASVMSSMVKGKSRDEVARIFDVFHKLVTGDASGVDAVELGRLAAFSGVSEFPARVKCATLAWHTLNAALNGEGQAAVTTE